MKKIIYLVFLSFWYLICFNVFIFKKDHVGDSPQLRSRLGTILSHSSDHGGEEHLYCYYPKSSASYDNKAGEYIIKRANNLSECENFFGAIIFHEGWWVSEKEKIWWSDKQKMGERLVKL